MLWFWLALGSALAIATTDALTKKYFSGLAPFEMGYVRLFYAAPWLAGPFLLTPAPDLPSAFWLLLALAIPLETAAMYLYMRALQVSPLSLTIPFLAFTPVWLMLTAWLVLGELPSPWGAAGIILVTAGAYALNLDTRSQSLFGPIRAIFREPGSRMMLLVSAIFAMTVSLGKKMLLLSGVTYFGTMYFLLLTVILGPALWATGRIRIPNLLARPGWGLAVGLGNAVMIMTHVWAVSMAPAAYMVSVKRLSLIFAVFYGRFIFKEAHFGERLLGVILMFVGVVLITWRG